MSGDLGSGRGLARATTSNLELCAREVELGNTAGVVNSELLDAEEVLSSGELRWDGNGVSDCDIVSNTSYWLPNRFESLLNCFRVLDLLARSHVACPPEKGGPISLILNQSLEPSAEAAESTLVM